MTRTVTSQDSRNDQDAPSEDVSMSLMNVMAPRLEEMSESVSHNHEALNRQKRTAEECANRIPSLMEPSVSSVPIGFASGHVVDVSGLTVTVAGLDRFLVIGDQVRIHSGRGGKPIPFHEVMYKAENEAAPFLVRGEVIAFSKGLSTIMTYEAIDGISSGDRVSVPLYDHEKDSVDERTGLPVNDSWIGRVVDPFGSPMDGKGALLPGSHYQSRRSSPPLATKRARLGPVIDLGVKTMNLFTTCREGQRLGLMAGSGVGKSSLMGMLSRYTECDVAVVSLIGERGREVREFMEDDLGEQGLRKTVMVVATSDTSPLMRREAAYSAMSVAEYFRDQGKSVLLLMDSVTRFCQALREIGLSSGEVPATRGYPPSVFATLPKLLERAGPGVETSGEKAGQITGLFSVLVDGDDHNEPVADTVRGILDGHVVMDRSIAEQGRYPAIDVLKSLSRSVPGCLNDDQKQIVSMARKMLAEWENVRELVKLGAYKEGSSRESDIAIQLGPKIENYLIQGKNEGVSLAKAFHDLSLLIVGPGHEVTMRLGDAL